MRIGVIGAGLAGLAAGRTLTKAGHEVCIFEEHGCTGGRLATWMAPSEPVVPVDYGYPFLSGSSPEFSRFLAELLEKNLLTVWGNNVAHFDGEQVHSESPNRKPDLRYAAPGGFSKISQYMERWVDIRYGEHAIGLTYIGSGRRKKRPWMINLESFKTFEADAVIVALPAPSAYGIIENSRDETPIMKVIREIDNVRYDPLTVVMAGYGRAVAPEWDILTARSEIIESIVVESSKRESPETQLVIRSTPEFVRKYEEKSEDYTKRALFEEAGRLIGPWASNPVWSRLHTWLHYRPERSLNHAWFEADIKAAPLALVGDYLGGSGAEFAYRSGELLAENWSVRFRD